MSNPWDTTKGRESLRVITMPNYDDWDGSSTDAREIWLSCARDMARMWLQRRGWRVAYRPPRAGPRSSFYSIERWDPMKWTAFRFGWLPIHETRRNYDAALVTAIHMAKGGRNEK